ncbi:MAG: fibronectin type III domain-containing protein [Clostridia bacterium]|nr:fibronectin type III domain-containing protein [Clostridia bacterium]
MKRILSLVLAVVMVAVLMCGCSEEYAVKVSKNGKTKITVISAIPVEVIEDMKNPQVSEGENGEVSMAPSMSEDALYESDTPILEDTIIEDDSYLEYNSEDDLYGGYSEDSLEDMEIKTINGVECYVGEETESFSSTTKANKHMLKEYGEDGAGYFKSFKVTTKQFTATMTPDINGVAALMGGGCDLYLSITLPYTITKTNGVLSDDKKTVRFDILKDEKIYAYTTKSDKGNKIYFKKDYLKSNSSVYLSWNSVKGAKNYKVQYKVSSADKWKSVTTKKTSITIKDLKAGKKYSFKVTATTKSKKYTSITTTETTLKKVTATVKSKTKDSVKLTWKKNTNADGYKIYQKTSKSGSWKTVKTVKDPYTTTYTVKKLKSNKNYYFKVVSYSKENGKTVKSSGETVKAKTKK